MRVCLITHESLWSAPLFYYTRINIQLCFKSEKTHLDASFLFDHTALRGPQHGRDPDREGSPGWRSWPNIDYILLSVVSLTLCIGPLLLPFIFLHLSPIGHVNPCGDSKKTATLCLYEPDFWSFTEPQTLKLKSHITWLMYAHGRRPGNFNHSRQNQLSNCFQKALSPLTQLLNKVTAPQTK